MGHTGRKQRFIFAVVIFLVYFAAAWTTVRPKEWALFSGEQELALKIEHGIEPILFLVKREYAMDENGERAKAVRLPELENGDVLVTDAVFCLGWRHGHAAIVVDAKRGITLEAFAVGTTSDFDRTAQWEYYPRVRVLRLKAPKEMRDQIAEYAKTELVGLPYRLATGMVDDKDMRGNYWGTQCAHLVWLAFYHFGYDVDGDGGWLVTPHDLAISEQFEAVPLLP